MSESPRRGDPLRPVSKAVENVDLIVVDGGESSYPAQLNSITEGVGLIMFLPAVGTEPRNPIALPYHRVFEILYDRPLPES